MEFQGYEKKYIEASNMDLNPRNYRKGEDLPLWKGDVEVYFKKGQGYEFLKKDMVVLYDQSKRHLKVFAWCDIVTGFLVFEMKNGSWVQTEFVPQSYPFLRV